MKSKGYLAKLEAGTICDTTSLQYMENGKMTVKELIELNAMITDLEITVRKDGNLLLDQLNIGPAEGVKPPYPMRVPKSEKYAGSLNQHNDDCYKDAAYIPKSINAWDDGKDYYEIKVNRIPAKWLELEVYSWQVWKASSVATTSPRRYHNNNFQGQLMNLVALPSGEKLEVKQEEKTEESLPGQMSIEDYLEAIHEQEAEE